MRPRSQTKGFLTASSGRALRLLSSPQFAQQGRVSLSHSNRALGKDVQLVPACYRCTIIRKPNLLEVFALQRLALRRNMLANNGLFHPLALALTLAIVTGRIWTWGCPVAWTLQWKASSKEPRGSNCRTAGCFSGKNASWLFWVASTFSTLEKRRLVYFIKCENIWGH